MAYLFYFLGFVMVYRFSQHYAIEIYKKTIPEWYHIAAALIWPIVIVLAMLSDIKDMIVGVRDGH